MAKKISIIIPVLNEARTIKATITSTRQAANNLEVIVVDGGSQDSTVEIIQSLGVKLLSATAGRANQLNIGAKAASGDILLFLHGDTCLPTGFDTMIRTALLPANTVGGAFALRLDGSFVSLRLIEIGVNWRSRHLQMPYGDQAIFIKTEVFHKVGGFPELPIMEDFELMRRLRRCGRITILNSSVLTSARRWQKLGVLKTTLINFGAIAAYLLGVPPTQICRWYHLQGRD